MEIQFMIGLPGSGKSTWAKNWVNEDPTNRVRINKDDLRNMLHQGKYSKGNEKQVLAIEESIILDSLSKGKSVVLDNTHLALDYNKKNKNLTRILDVLHTNGYVDHPSALYKKKYVKININDLTHITPEQCIINDLKRENSVGQNIIWRMYWDHIAIIETQIFNNLHHDSIIVDIDGTLASMHNRGPYDFSKVANDKVRSHIRTLVNIYADAGYKILIVSGREDYCYDDTIDWLITHDIQFDSLYMRATKDNRKDCFIKREIYYNHIKPNYNVHLVLDDRPQVIREWRRLGLNVINVNPIDEEF